MSHPDSLIQPVSSSSQYQRPTGLSPFALSFERITIESLAASWQELEALVKQLAEKRLLVEQHTKLAADHIRAVSMVNTEIDSLEKKFSSILAGMVAERTRVQDKLRGLVLEWERCSAQNYAERSKESQKAHEDELRQVRDKLEELQRERDSKDVLLLQVQQKNKDLELLLSEYGLSTTGPLVESLRARAVIAQQQGGALSPQPNMASLSGGLNSNHYSLTETRKNSTLQQQHVMMRRSSIHVDPAASAAEREMIVESERLRLEVTKLQADLAASKAESRMRLDEVKALRAVRDESSPSQGGAGMPAFYQLSGSGGGPKSVASTSNMSAAAMSQSRHLFEEHGRMMTTSSSNYDDARRYPNAPQQVPVQQSPKLSQKMSSHMSLGLDLGTRRQQLGLRGVHVTDVVEGSSAYNAGIRRNDVLLTVAGRPTDRLEDVAAAIGSVRPHSQLVIEYARQPAMTSPIVGDPQRAVILVEGQLDGPHNTRREHFRSP